METRYITIATMNKSDAGLFSKLLESRNIICQLTGAKSVKATEQDGIRIKVHEKDRKVAIHELEEFIKTYGIKESDQDVFSHEVERILVPVDFSEASKNACQYAIGLAKFLDAEIMLLHAYYFPVVNAIDYGDGLSFVVGLDDTITQIAEKAKQGIVELYEELLAEIKIKNYLNVKLNFTLANGNPIHEIMNMYINYRPDMIIMGTHGKSAAEKEHFGSVAIHTINEVKIPLLTIPENAKFKGIGKINILYATSFDESDYKAIKKLMTLIYLFDVKVFFVHIGKKDDTGKQKLEMNKELFCNLYPGYECVCEIIEDVNVTDALERFIDDQAIDIIAMTTHKRNFFSQLIHPSFTRKMFFKSKIPMLVFHAR
ncbi:MAG: universal stress protein [Bacteroidales bacterium]